MRTNLLAPIALVFSLVACGTDAPPAQQPDAAANCGGACGPGTVCSAGRCVPLEPDGSAPDAPGVEASAPDAGCAAGADSCGVLGACFSFATSRDHCGGCQYQCPAWSACVRGACAPSWNPAGTCPAGEVDCDRMEATGCEANIRSGRSNCGACGVACGAGLDCREGRCVAP